MITEFTPFSFETAAPESVGIDSEAIAAFEARLRAEKLGHQGYMIYRSRKLAASAIASPYRFTDKRHVYSISKSYTSTAVGIAVDEGLISVEDSVISFFPELLPGKVSENLAAMKIKHLLTMNTGHQEDTLGRVATREPGWAKRFLSLPVENAPGTHFAYNSTATYMLSAIITKVTGMRMVDYLRTRLFNPLGIDGVTWEESPDGISDGGWGIHVSPEDMLKLGVLYLNKGVWNGQRIISEEWVKAATSYQSDNSANRDADWHQGYGYQFWRCRHDSFRADGAFGQYIIVSPDKELVTVIISETGRMQAVLDAYWDTIYASLRSEPLPTRTVECDVLPRPYLELPEKLCRPVEPVEYRVSENRLGLSKLSIRSEGEALILRLGSAHERSVELICGSGLWVYNRFQHCPVMPTGFLGPLSVGVFAEIAASWGGEADSSKLLIRLQFVSTPHGFMLELDPDRRVLSVTTTLDHIVSPVELDLI